MQAFAVMHRHPVHRRPHRRWRPALGRLGRRQLRQRPGRVHHRAAQNRTDLPPQTLAHDRATRIRAAGVHRLVEPPPPARRDRHAHPPPKPKPPTTLKPGPSPRRCSQRTEPLQKPERFNPVTNRRRGQRYFQPDRPLLSHSPPRRTAGRTPQPEPQQRAARERAIPPNTSTKPGRATVVTPVNK
jgi:hypothetical protein